MNGILMTPDNHLAIRELRKTQTRRLAGLAEINKEPHLWQHYPTVIPNDAEFFLYCDTEKRRAIKPRYHVGEVVYIKEAHYLFGQWWWAHGDDSDDVRFIRDITKPIYYADTKPLDLPIKRGHLFADKGWYLRSPMFLSEKDARDFIQITDVRPERLQDITKEDVEAEGTRVWFDNHPDLQDEGPLSAQQVYSLLWDSINKVVGIRWSDNPWVWVISFVKCEKHG